MQVRYQTQRLHFLEDTKTEMARNPNMDAFTKCALKVYFIAQWIPLSEGKAEIPPRSMFGNDGNGGRKLECNIHLCDIFTSGCVRFSILTDHKSWNPLKI